MDANNPYVGPRSFNRGEMLYGRDDEARRLADLVMAERIVLLYSPSGAGKTSLIQARLIPKLIEEAFVILPTIRVNATHGSGDPANATNRYVLSTLLSLEKSFPAEQQIPLADLLSLSVGDYFDRRYPEQASQDLKPTLLFFDQFEEILTLDPTDCDAKTAFFKEIGKLLRNSHYWALFAMREDFLAGLDSFVQLIPTRLGTRYRLDFLDTKHASEAIRKPAAKLDVTFTAAEKLAADLSQILVQQANGDAVLKAGSWVEPVQLQVVCRRVWDKPRKDPKEISEADLNISGTSDVDSALADYYEDRITSIATETNVEERAIREWFSSNLITERGIRGQVLRGESESGGLPNRVVEELLNDYLIRPEERRGGIWYELAHDRLVEPIRTSNVLWANRTLSPLESRAAEWEAKSRRSQLLLHGEELVAAARWAKLNPEKLKTREAAFVAASRGAATDLESAAIDWELSGRSTDQLLRGEALAAAVNTPDAQLSDIERGLVRASATLRDDERRGQLRQRRTIGLLVAISVLSIGFAVAFYRALRFERQFVEKQNELQIKQSQLLTEQDQLLHVQKQRQALAQTLQSTAVALTRQYALTSDSAAATHDPVQRLEAQARIADLLPEKQSSATTLQYFAKQADGEKFISALKDIGIPIKVVTAHSTSSTNCIWYGSDVPANEVRLVAYALIRAGAELQGIQPFFKVDTHVIQVGRNPRVADQTPITLAMIDSEPLTALKRKEADYIGTHEGEVLSFDPGKREGSVKQVDGQIVIFPFRASDPTRTFVAGDRVRFAAFDSDRGRYAEDVKKAIGLEQEGPPRPESKQ